MQQFMSIWGGLTPRRRITALLATAAAFAAVLLLARMAAAPNLTLLYAGLESGPAGEVVRALEQRGVPFEVRGGSILVDGTKRDELRMTLASEGLPANSSRGYELLDSLSGFGTTSQMFDAAYWRAKEGELARTLVANPAIVSARVHIATTGSNPFQRDVRPTASVSVSGSGGAVPAAQARAARYLVASAVAGLDPEDVSVIDAKGGLIGSADAGGPAPDAIDRSVQLRESVQRLVEAHVGFGNSVVEVAVETEKESESIRERRFDPEARVVVSTDTEERSTQSSDNGAGGDVTVASNLPDGDARTGEQSTSQNSESRERVNYEVSETEREVMRGPGAIKRLSVAVLVNGRMVTAPDGTATFEPLPDEKVTALTELVASAVGFDEARGDVITIKSMAFEPAAVTGTAGGAGSGGLPFDMMTLIQSAILAFVALVLGLFVVRPILSRPSQPLALVDPGTASGAGMLPALTGEIAEDEAPGTMLAAPGRDDMAEHEGKRDPVERLRAMIGERQEETVEILRSWLDEKQENV